MATDSKMAPTPALWIPQPTVTFIVDKEEIKQTFVIHKSLATSTSSFFKAAFEGQFIKGQTQTVRLEDVESQIFGLLVQWLYTRVLAECLETEDHNTEAPLLACAKLWTLAGRCLIASLQEYLISHLIHFLQVATTRALTAFANHAYEDGQDDTALKRLAVDAIAFLIDTTKLKSCIKALPYDLVVDVTMRLKEETITGRNTLRGADYYGPKACELKPEAIIPSPREESPVDTMNGIEWLRKHMSKRKRAVGSGI